MAPRKKTTLVQCLSEIEDPRVRNGKRHDLVEVLLIAVCAIFAEVQGFEDMAEWAQVKEAWLRRFLRLENGIPSHAPSTGSSASLTPSTSSRHSGAGWAASRAFGAQVSVDGKSLRGSALGGESPVQMVSAFATGLGIVLGQEKIADKSNEITAIPALLEALAIEGCLVSIDAMGAQREIARAIRDMGADICWQSRATSPPCTRPWKAPSSATGTRSTTRCRLAMDAMCSRPIARWPTLKNRLHWSLDVIFGEDAWRLTEGNGPQNFSLLTKMALNLLRQHPPEGKKNVCTYSVSASAGMTRHAWPCWGSRHYDIRVRSPCAWNNCPLWGHTFPHALSVSVASLRAQRSIAVCGTYNSLRAMGILSLLQGTAKPDRPAMDC